MTKPRTHTRRRGQSVLEYSLMVVVLIVVILAMNVYFKRALQGKWKSTSDQIGKQFTTNQFYTIETRQQSARTEATATEGTDGEIAGNNWVRSTIMDKTQYGKTGFGAPNAAGGIGGIETGYAGHETTKTDYVTQAIAAKTLGAHGTFDSGKLSNIRLFDDD